MRLAHSVVPRVANVAGGEIGPFQHGSKGVSILNDVVDVRRAGEKSVAGSKMMIQTRRPLIVVDRLRKLKGIGISSVLSARVVGERIPAEDALGHGIQRDLKVIRRWGRRRRTRVQDCHSTRSLCRGGNGSVVRFAEPPTVLNCQPDQPIWLALPKA